MIKRSLYLLAMTAFVSAAAATQAMACCGCAATCAPAAPIQAWGVSPSYAVNQGPVFSGPGFYTAPTYEGEVSTVDYPYGGRADYPFYSRPYEGGFYRFRHALHHRYWEGALPARPHHFAVLERREGGVLYRHGFGPRAITMSREERWIQRGHRELRYR